MSGRRTFEDKIVTIDRYILDQQSDFPEATGALTSLLYDIALAAKLIASHTNRAGLADILGSTGTTNVQGEVVQKLDAYAERTIYRLNDHTGRVAVMASEEEEEVIPIPPHHTPGKYTLVYDPLDGSSNIDVNVSVGTIFAIHRRKSEGGPGTLEDCLQPGRDLVAAGYVVYGSSTMLVYSTGNGVHGFTLDPRVGEFFLSHPNIQIPARANVLQRESSVRAGLVARRAGVYGVAARRAGERTGVVATLHRLTRGGFSPQSADRGRLLLSRRFA